ncbi:MAG: DEAD/DEAH box helicase [Chlamydiota bacterium]
MRTVAGIVEKETAKAFLLRHADGREIWWPKSQIAPVRKEGRMMSAAVPGWLAEDKGINGDDGDFGPLVEMEKKEKQSREGRAEASVKAVSTLTVPCPEGLEYLSFQVAGIEYIENTKGRTLVADECGLGKTIQALGWLNLHPELRPAVVICPASMKLQWYSEARRWLMTPRGTIDVVKDGKDAPTPGHDLYVINYDLVHKHEEAFRAIGVRVVILDESHYLKAQKTIRTKAVLRVCDGIQHVLCLSGTPILNKPIEAWTTLRLLAPKTFRSWFDYVTRFCNGHKQKIGRDREVWQVDGSSNLDEMNSLMRETCFVRRLKKDVMAELPAKRRVIVPIGDGCGLRGEADFTRRLKGIVARRRAEQRDLARVKDERERTRQRDSLLVRMREENTEILSEIEKLRQEAAREKMGAACEFIENILEQGKLVVFAHHKFVIDELMKQFKGSAVIRGETSVEDRQRAVERFQNNPECRLFIGSLHAASQGITLTAASDVVFMELDWVPGIMVQGEDRCHRIGTRSSVTAWYLVLDGSIEVRMARILEQKQAVLDAVLDGKAAEAAGSIFDELIAEVADEDNPDEKAKGGGES